MSTRGPVPNRWLHCPRKSEQIIAERFIAFKTPLSNAFKDQMPINCMFPPEMIFGYIKTLKLKLGLWIDLTNTKRFYDREIVETRGTQYVKLQCRGHGETPSPEQTRSFIEIVDNFINERPFDIIGVHCTHGFNRTGFLIVSYMVERLDCSVEAALGIFSKARPPGIYKQDYINELFRRYEDEEDAPPAPELPEWCLEYDDSNGNERGSNKRKLDDKFSSTSSALHSNSFHESNGDEYEESFDECNDSQNDDNTGEGTSTDSNDKPAKKRRREPFKKDAEFMPGVPGVVLVIDQPRLANLQLKVQQLCGWEKSGFPGAQPVSMDRTNLKNLHEHPYRVSWKADGTRYMMLINERNGIFFFDRNYSCFQVENLTFLVAGNLTEHLTDTLLDGEMVLDKLKGQTIPRYLIYDIVSISTQKAIGSKPFFPNRMNCIKNEIMEPRIQAITKGLIDRPKESFSVRHKEFWEIRQSASLLGAKFAKSLLHEPDGLIFQPSTSKYVPGVCPDVLKWKPTNMNSIDFRLKITVESGAGLLRQKIGHLYVGGFDVPFQQIKYTKALKDLDNKIIECSYNNGKWEFMRERKDKIMPNSYNTANSVLQSIREPVTTEMLLDFIDRHGYQDDNDKMPPPNNIHNHHAHRQQPSEHKYHGHGQQEQEQSHHKRQP